MDYQQWSSFNYDFTLKYTVCKPGFFGDTDYCSNSSSIKNQNNTHYMELGSAPSGSGRKIRFNVTSGGNVYISGNGQVYQAD